MPNNYYKNVKPSEAKVYFSDKMLEDLQTNLIQQIRTKEVEHLAAGEGIYIFEDGSKKSNLNVAVHVRWTCNELGVLNLHVLQYHLYSGDFPNEVLDELNKLQAGHKPEWKHYE